AGPRRAGRGRSHPRAWPDEPRRIAELLGAGRGASSVLREVPGWSKHAHRKSPGRAGKRRPGRFATGRCEPGLLSTGRGRGPGRYSGQLLAAYRASLTAPPTTPESDAPPLAAAPSAGVGPADTSVRSALA